MQNLRDYITDQRKGYVVQAVREAGGNVARAAKVLGVSLASAYRILDGDFELVRFIPKRVKPVPTFALIHGKRRLDFNRNDWTPNLLRFFGCHFTNREWQIIKTQPRKLSWLYYDCRQEYLKLVDRYHPDHGGNGECYEINARWQLLKRRMQQLGIEP